MKPLKDTKPADTWLLQRDHIVRSDDPEAQSPKACPACSRGFIIKGVCSRCKVGIARGVETPRVHCQPKYRRKQDQQELRGMADYVSTRKDQG